MRPRGPYKIKVGSRIVRVEVGEREIREGVAITVPTGDPPGDGADPAC